jgi:hypothetical protein
MPKPVFINADDLAARIDSYFTFIEGEYHLENKPGKDTDVTIKVCDREPEPATFAGLTLYIGFNSRQAFDDYEQNGPFAETLKYGRLRIEASYEKKLHAQSSAGAIFALKSMGWNERAEVKTGEQLPKTMQVEIIESGPKTAGNEKDVVLYAC